MEQPQPLVTENSQSTATSNSAHSLWHVLAQWITLLLLSFIVFRTFCIFLRRKLSFGEPLSPLSLSIDSRIVITGGCMGLGLSLALCLARRFKSHLIIVDVRKDLFTQVAAQINAMGATCDCLYCDLSDQRSVAELVATLREHYQQIDLLINNAGIACIGANETLSMDMHRRLFNVNYFSPISVTQSLLDRLHSGHIVIVSSMLGIIHGGLKVAAYGASKHALLGWTSSFRQELKTKGLPVTVSIVCPYVIKTAMFKGLKTDLDWLIPHLDVLDTAENIIQRVVSREQVCYLSRKHGFVFRTITMALPSWLIDWIVIKFDVSVFQQPNN